MISVCTIVIKRRSAATTTAMQQQMSTALLNLDLHHKCEYKMFGKGGFDIKLSELIGSAGMVATELCSKKLASMELNTRS